MTLAVTWFVNVALERRQHNLQVNVVLMNIVKPLINVFWTDVNSAILRQVHVVGWMFVVIANLLILMYGV